MTVNERKKRKAIRMWIVRGFFGPIAAYCLVSHIRGTISTVELALEAKYPADVVHGMAVGMALLLVMPFFLQYRNYFFRLLCSITIMMTSIMAINSLTQKELLSGEERLLQDAVYQQLTEKWKGLENQYEEAQRNVNKYLDLQMTTGKDWSAGARSAREERSALLLKKESAWNEAQERRIELEKGGSRSYQAYVISISSFLPFLEKDTIENSSNLMLSFVNDIGGIFYASVLVFLFGKWIMIPVPKWLRSDKKEESLVRGMFGKCSEIVRRSFGIRSEKKREPRCLGGTMLRGGVVILRIFTEMKEAGNRITVREIGEMAAKEMEKFRPKDQYGNPIPYSAGFVSEICSPNGRYRQLLQQKAGVC